MAVCPSLVRALRILGACCLLAASLGVHAAEGADTAFTRDKAAGLIRDARRVVNPGGVERLEAVPIGGIEQWVSIRGRDLNNPILLFIHGGPGYVSIPMSWWFTRGWEEYFTVVQWDQRGSGKTYLLNDPTQVAPTLTLQRMQADTEEMVTWLRKEFGKKKIVVIGHSWGSYLGLELAQKHPEWLYAYIGVGQLTNGPESERRGWAYAMERARNAGNAQAMADLQSVAPYFSPDPPASLQSVYTQRKWLEFYGGAMAYRSGTTAESALYQLSPDYSDAEIAHVWEGNEFTEKYLLKDVLALDLSTRREFHCPIFIFDGRNDFNINSQLAAEWFRTVKAPVKRFVWFEQSGHLPMTEEPGKFLISLASFVRPLAREGPANPASRSD
jgi:proline iminopeptidase